MNRVISQQGPAVAAPTRCGRVSPRLRSSAVIGRRDRRPAVHASGRLRSLQAMGLRIVSGAVCQRNLLLKDGFFELTRLRRSRRRCAVPTAARFLDAGHQPNLHCSAAGSAAGLVFVCTGIRGICDSRIAPGCGTSWAGRPASCSSRRRTAGTSRLNWRSRSPAAGYPQRPVVSSG